VSPVVVLVVDPDPRAGDEARQALEDDLIEVVTAPSALHALHILEEHVVDVVVSESHGVGLDGVRLLESVSTRWPETSCVLSTRFPDGDVFVEAVNRGHVRKILVRPREPSAFRAEIDELVNECLARRGTF